MSDIEDPVYWEMQKQITDLQKQIAENQTAIALAQKATRDANASITPVTHQGQTKGLQGTITSSENHYLTTLLTYEALHLCAKEIGNIMYIPPSNDNSPTPILIVNSLDLVVDHLVFHHVRAQLDQLTQQVNSSRKSFIALLEDEIVTVHPNPVPSRAVPSLASPEFIIPGISQGLAAASTVLSLLGDVAGYFKADVMMSAQEVTISDEALCSAVAGQLPKYASCLLNFAIPKESPLLEDFVALIRIRADLETMKEHVGNKIKDIITVQADILNATEPDEVLIHQLSSQANKAQAALNEWTNTSATIGSFVTTLLGISDGQQRSLLMQAALREQINIRKIKQILYLKITSSGGETVIKQRVLRSSQVMYFGSITASYIFADIYGQIIDSNIVSKLCRLDHYTDTAKISSPTEIPLIQRMRKTNTP